MGKSETGNEYDEAEAAESDENMNGIANAHLRMGESNFDYNDQDIYKAKESDDEVEGNSLDYKSQAYTDKHFPEDGDYGHDYYDGYEYEVDDNLDDDDNKFKVNYDEIEFNDDYDYYDADVKNENNAEDEDSEEESIENFQESDNIKSRSVKSKKKNRRIQSKILNRKL